MIRIIIIESIVTAILALMTYITFKEAQQLPIREHIVWAIIFTFLFALSFATLIMYMV